MPNSNSYAISVLTSKKSEGRISIWNAETLRKINELNDDSAETIYKLAYDETHKLLYAVHQSG
jgi:hypothetical protein